MSNSQNTTGASNNIASSMASTRRGPVPRTQPTDNISNIATNLRELSLDAPIEQYSGARLRANNNARPTPIGSEVLSTSTTRPAALLHPLQRAARRTASTTEAENIPNFLRPVTTESSFFSDGRIATGVSRGPSASASNAQRNVASENTAVVENFCSSNTSRSNPRAANTQPKPNTRAPTTRATNEHGNQRLQGGRRPVNLATIQSWRPQQPQQPQKPQQPQQPQKPQQPQQPQQPQPRRAFKPMQAVTDPDAANRPLTEEEREYRRAKGISENYRGDTRNPENICADIPDSENCSLFVWGLPPDCSYKDWFEAVAVYKPGRVHTSVIYPPDKNAHPSQLSYSTSAAKITFYRPEEAARLLHIIRAGQLKLRDYRVYGAYNRTRVAAQPPERSHTSRCIIISGPQAFINEDWLLDLFYRNFKWKTEQVIVLREDSGYRSLEWRFASYRGQACTAVQVLWSKFDSATVSVWYAQDPCALAGPWL